MQFELQVRHLRAEKIKRYEGENRNAETAGRGNKRLRDASRNRLHGEFFELNPLGTALRGRNTGRAYRLGDGIAVRVESIARNEGKIELALAPASGGRTPGGTGRVK